jgi:hypothetical protein
MELAFKSSKIIHSNGVAHLLHNFLEIMQVVPG